MNGVRRRFVWELDWNLLRTFIVIVQERGLTAASEKLFVQQPAISSALNRLETHIGCRLIERSAAHFSVTPAGQRLYVECCSLFNIVNGLPAATDIAPNELTGHVEIALASHVVCGFFDQLLTQFHLDYPNVSLSTQVMPSHQAAESVLDRAVGFGICLMHERLPKLNYVELYREHFGYFCGPGHSLYGQSDLPLEALRHESYVSFQTDQMSSALWPVALLRQQNGFDGPVLGTSSHLEEVKRLILAGFGFGPLPIHVVQDDIQSGRLWRLPPYDSPPMVSVYVIHDPSARRSKAESLLLERLLSLIHALPIADRTFANPQVANPLDPPNK